jgi:hypothetical protein
MKTNEQKLSIWVQQLANTKPYRMVLKKGQGFYEVVFYYLEYHYNDRIALSDMNDELKCQKKILDMCATFERNFKLKVF